MAKNHRWVICCPRDSSREMIESKVSKHGYVMETEGINVEGNQTSYGVIGDLKVPDNILLDKDILEIYYDANYQSI